MERIPALIDLMQVINAKDVGTIYASVNERETIYRRGKPKVTLYFLEDSNYNKKAAPNKIPEGRRRQEAVVRFRLMDELTQTFSKANATALGRKIKEVFGGNEGFIWQKGKTMYSYTDWERGYQFQLLCKTETEAKRIITSVHSLQSHTPNWRYFNTIKSDEEATKFPENPGNQVVMGETVPIPKDRPIVDVRFQYAYVKLSGVIKPITLYDRRNKQAEALVR